MKGKHYVAITGIVCISAIEITNIVFIGIDSTFLSIVVGAIATIVGWAFGKRGD